MEPFDICWKASPVLLVDLDLVHLKSRLWCLIHRNGQTTICLKVNFTSHETNGGRVHLQLTPRVSQAASTSGPASCRNTFALSSEPLNVTVWREVSTSFKTGASNHSAWTSEHTIKGIHTISLDMPRTDVVRICKPNTSQPHSESNQEERRNRNSECQ